jgi:hypothetical protein
VELGDVMNILGDVECTVDAVFCCVKLGFTGTSLMNLDEGVGVTEESGICHVTALFES